MEPKAYGQVATYEAGMLVAGDRVDAEIGLPTLLESGRLGPMEHQRVEIHQLQISDYEKLPEIFENFNELIEEIGYNPFKGM